MNTTPPDPQNSRPLPRPATHHRRRRPRPAQIAATIAAITIAVVLGYALVVAAITLTDYLT